MAKKFNELPVASALTGTEILAVDQNNGGLETRQTTTQAIANLAPGASDASAVTFTPIDPTDWNGSIDPGNVDDALDQLAQRVVDLEGAGGGSAGRHSDWIGAGSMRPRGTNGCDALNFLAGASNQPDVEYLAFDASSTEYAEFGWRMPPSWNEGTLTFEPVWMHPATATNFGVVWGLQGVAISNDDPIAATFGTAQTSTDTGGTTHDIYFGPESSAITLAGTPQPGDYVRLRVYRDPTNGSDTLAVDAWLLGITVYLTTDASTD